MNSIYQIQIALNFAVCFFNTVSVLFTTISEYRANTDWTLWISGLLWVTYYILRVIMVCTSASAVIEQVCYRTFLRFIDQMEYLINYSILSSRLNGIFFENYLNTGWFIRGSMKLVYFFVRVKVFVRRVIHTFFNIFPGLSITNSLE